MDRTSCPSKQTTFLGTYSSLCSTNMSYSCIRFRVGVNGYNSNFNVIIVDVFQGSVFVTTLSLLYRNDVLPSSSTVS